MYKIMVHIKNENTFIDDNVSVQIELPAVPRNGEFLYLDNDSIQILEDKAKSDLKIARNYAPKWFYRGSVKVEEVEQDDLINLSFHDAIQIDSVAFKANSDIIYVELE
jgi:hypothetical protein